VLSFLPPLESLMPHQTVGCATTAASAAGLREEFAWRVGEQCRAVTHGSEWKATSRKRATRGGRAWEALRGKRCQANVGSAVSSKEQNPRCGHFPALRFATDSEVPFDAAINERNTVAVYQLPRGWS